METLDLAACYRELGFSEPPFCITPDTGFFFPGGRHVAALEHLKYGLLSGGFTMLTGEVGLGKTLLCRKLLKSVPKGIRTAYIFNPAPSYEQLLKTIYYDLVGEQMEASSFDEAQRTMSATLVGMAEKGEKVAVVLDEAHRFGPEALEGLRLLSNLETEKEKLIYLMLVGQPELERTVASVEMRPLAQRISVRYRLRPFSFSETYSYIRHRLGVAKINGGGFGFSRSATLLVHAESGGVPRRINQICDRAMLAAFSKGANTVGAPMIWRASREIMGAA